MDVSSKYQISFCTACTAELSAYLLSDNLYWPLSTKAPSGLSPFPRMTIGSLLLSLVQTRALAVTTAQLSEVDRIEIELNTLRMRWRAVWDRKAHAEFDARVRRWKQFLAQLHR